jgi:GLPGLI family protein
MKNKLIVLIGIFIIAPNLFAQTVRVLAECTVTYTVSFDEATTEKNTALLLSATSKTVYIKGNNSKVELASPSFTQSVIYDKATGNAVILREIGNNKFMTKLDNAKWVAQNAKFQNAVFTPTSETKIILGYACKKGILQLTDGNTFTLYYATNIAPSVKEFEYQFKDVPGFVLEYESQEQEGKKVRYVANKINLSPVLSTKFDIPVSGYRILN